jgi:lipid-A-disaccharide synthase
VNELLVVSGEASGDRAASAVLERLGPTHAFGLGGGASAAAGLELLGDIRDWTALGVGEAAARGHRVWQAFRAVSRAARLRRPRAALLVNYTEFNARLAPRLHARGVCVLWYGAPQVWAWRPGRVASLRPAIDRLATMLPFEEELWRRGGVDAHYVGHPALEVTALDRTAAREALGLTPLAAAVALLPGSRPHEIRSLLLPMLDAYLRVRADRASVDARVLLASSLDAPTRAWVRATSQAHGVETFDVDPASGAGAILPAFDASLCASGTVSLEAALARAIPVVTYRVGILTELTARALVRTPHVALPNVLLGRRAFPELLQREATGPRIALALAEVLERRRAMLVDCDAVETCLRTARRPSTAVARMLAPWLAESARAA